MWPKLPFIYVVCYKWCSVGKLGFYIISLGSVAADPNCGIVICAVENVTKFAFFSLMMFQFLVSLRPKFVRSDSLNSCKCILGYAFRATQSFR